MSRPALTERQRSSLLTVFASVIPNIFIMIFGALKTRAMISCLGSEVNGAYQIMVQLTSFVAFTNLGLDTAFRVNYYRMLAADDREKVSAVYRYSIRFFRRITMIMLGVAGIISLAALIFVSDVFLKWQVILIQFLLCMPSVTYFMIGNEVALADARQKGYIYIFWHNLAYLARLVLTLYIIYHYKNLLAALIADAFISTSTNWMIGRYLKKSNSVLIDSEKTEDSSPVNYSRYVIAYRLASLVFYNTDNIVLALFFSKTKISIYAAYIYIANCLVAMTSYLTSSFTNAVGNLLHSHETYKEAVVNELFWLVSYILLICCIPLAAGMERFVSGIWIGKPDYIVNPLLYFMIVMYFALDGYMKIVEMMENSSALYQYTYKINLAEAVSNIVFSVLLVYLIGMNGIILATLMSMSIANIIKLKVIFRHLDMDYRHIRIRYVQFIVMAAAEIGIAMYCSRWYAGASMLRWIGLELAAGILSVVLNTGLLCGLFPEFRRIIVKYWHKFVRTA